MKLSKPTCIKIVIGITFTAILFHLLILTKVIPYEITWGGRLKTDEEMYVFESFSILISSFFIYVLLQKGSLVKAVFSEKAITIMLWIFFALFVLNTVGNIVAKTPFEKGFALVTLINAFLLWRINRPSWS
jgi:hypothetical protein